MEELKTLRRDYRKQMVMEWYEGYVNFISLQEPIAIIYQIYDRNHEEVFTQNHEKLVYKSLKHGSSDAETMRICAEYAHRINYVGLIKARAFAEYKKF